MDDKNTNQRKRSRNEPKPSSKSHIRFDEEGGDAEIDASNDVNAQSSPLGVSGVSKPSKDKDPRRNKRKRKQLSTNKKGDSATTTTTNPCNKIFNGLIVAISTLESSSQSNNTNNNMIGDEAATTSNTDNNNDPQQHQNYKTLKQLLQSLGATLSPQVHKRVHYLIATDGAVQNLTRRVRQALKRNVDIVDVAWIRECQEGGMRVDTTNHLCNELAQCLLVEKEKEKKDNVRKEGKKGGAKPDGGDGSDVPDDDNAGWSAPIQLDCCCVCHENGDDNCPWCADCNLTLARKANQCFPVK